MQLNKQKKWWFTPLILIIVIVLLHLFSFSGYFIETIYSLHFYPFISILLRIITAWIPFSFGDVLYALIFVWLLYKIIMFFKSKPNWKKFLMALRNLTIKFLWLYVCFLLMWGLNYYRYGIGYQLNIIPERYSTDDLKKTTLQLLLELNANARIIDSLHINYPSNKKIFDEAALMYNQAQQQYPYLKHTIADVKPMLAGITGNYGGFLGYYNPFTGEAQVNTDVPKFVIPFTTCHEMAHQIGYASESEASFVGFLVTKQNNQILFNYSMYFDLFSYANGELYHRDSMAAKANFKLLDTLVKKDFAAYRIYLKKYKNPFEPLLTKLYGSYLKAHNQPKGIQSYDEVVAWVVAYNKKYGKL